MESSVIQTTKKERACPLKLSEYEEIEQKGEKGGRKEEREEEKKKKKCKNR